MMQGCLLLVLLSSTVWCAHGAAASSSSAAQHRGSSERRTPAFSGSAFRSGCQNCGGGSQRRASRKRRMRVSASQGEEREVQHQILFVRHGQSTWNKSNRFIGWTDPELTQEGELEARVAGQVLAAEGYELDTVYSSLLKRAIKTAWVVLDELGQQHVPVVTDWRMNERCYGALVGRNKKECVREFGEEQVKTWRRSFDVRPPQIERESKYWPGNNPKYKFLLDQGLIPRAESLKDAMVRSSGFWEEVVVPSLREGKRVCIFGHENILRSLLKYIDGVSEEDILEVELPRAVPLLYHLDKELQPMPLEGSAPFLSGKYLGDPEEISAIMKRDLANVYDLKVTENLELVAGERHFAAKLEQLAPCEIDEEDLRVCKSMDVELEV